MAAYEFDCAYCGKHVVMEHDRGQRKKYCSKKCSSAMWEELHRGRKKGQKDKVTLSYPLVPVRQCAKCRYGLLVGSDICCAYFEIAGQTRTSLHPEGLTAECQEFKPRAMERKKIPLTVKG